MKIAVLSDIHGNGVALDYVIKDMEEQGINHVVILGEVVMKGPMPGEVMEALKKLSPLGWIKGNTDIWLEDDLKGWQPSSEREIQLYSYYNYAAKRLTNEQKAFLKELPLAFSFKCGNIEALCVHGTPKSIVEAIDNLVSEEDIRKAIEGTRQDIILSGHSHRTFLTKLDDKVIFNVGSIGNSLDGDNTASYGILEFTEEGLKIGNMRIEYPTEEILRIAEERKFPYFETYKTVVLKAGTQ
jgi:putative phosphoesterase